MSLSEETISSAFPFTKKHVNVLDASMAYVDVGPSSLKKTCIFLHGNPTSSYLWRNIIPHIEPHARCIAPDLIGMGDSAKLHGSEYRFTDHARYLHAFLDEVVPTGDVTLVLHDWGSALGLDWARTHSSRITGLVLMEFITSVPDWDNFSDNKEAKAAFQAFRAPTTGRQLLIEDNAFVEQILPLSVARALTEEEMDAYRKPFLKPEDREPAYRWPNELPIAGEPKNMYEIVDSFYAWLMESEVRKLFFWATPGGLISVEKASWYADHLKHVKSVGIGRGVHFLQEDNPHLIGREIAKWLE